MSLHAARSVPKQGAPELQSPQVLAQLVLRMPRQPVQGRLVQVAAVPAKRQLRVPPVWRQPVQGRLVQVAAGLAKRQLRVLPVPR